MMAATKIASPRASTVPLQTLSASAPQGKTTESTTTMVIGSGFSALAIAAELNRQGIKTIVVDSSSALKPPTSPPTTGGISLAALSERNEIVRLLEHYARRNELDIRPATQALDFTHHDGELAATQQWRVLTTTGTVTAHSIVFTRSALSQLRKVLHNVGVSTASDVRTGMQALGLYLVGVGDLAIPTTQEILHQAKRASHSISSRIAALEMGQVTAVA